MPRDILIGTYTEGRQSRGRGIYRATVAEDGTITETALVVRCRNPSYMVRDVVRDRVYSVQELDGGAGAGIIGFRWQDRQLTEVSRVDVDDGGPCHLAISPDGRFLACSFYQSGAVQIFALTDDEIRPVWTHRPSGMGVHPTRQRGPHAHCSAFLGDGDELAVVDLGLDTITIHSLSPDGSASPPAECIQLPRGCGARHLVPTMDGARLYVLAELDEVILSLCRQPSGGWNLTEIFRLIDRRSEADGAGAAIRLSPDERFLYTSSRSTSEITVTEVGAKGRPLKHVQTISTGGQCPRDIALSPDGELLIVGNEKSDQICVFLRHGNTGRLSLGAHADGVGSPACIVFDRVFSY